MGEDGALYHVQGLDLDEGEPPARSFFLGEDDVLYQGHGRIPDRAAGMGTVSRRSLGQTQEREPGRFFLGADGTLYEVVK